MRTRWLAPAVHLRGMSGLPVILIPAALAAAIAGAVATQPLVAGLAGLAVVVMVVANLWARLSLEDLTYQRSVSADHVFAGEEIELTLAITNEKPLPLAWLRVQDLVPSGLDVVGEPVELSSLWQASAITFTTSLAWYERARFKYRLRALRRGYYRFGPVQLESGDLFGLYARELRRRDPAPHVVVYPQTVPLPDFYPPSARPVGDARSRVRAWEDPTLPSGLREYRPDDPSHRIDWKATARRGSLLVRTYDPTSAHHVVVLADVASVEHPWEGVFWPFVERAITGAASIASRAFELGYRVGLITNGLAPAESVDTVAAPAPGIDRLAAVLETLAMVQPVAVGPIENAMEKRSESIPFGATIIAVTPLFRHGLRAKLAELQTRGHPVLAIHVGDGDLPQEPLTYEVRSMRDAFDPQARAESLLFQPPERRGPARV